MTCSHDQPTLSHDLSYIGTHLISLTLHSAGEVKQRPHEPITTFTQSLVGQLMREGMLNVTNVTGTNFSEFREFVKVRVDINVFESQRGGIFVLLGLLKS